MRRPSLTLVTLFAICVAGFLGYRYFTQAEPSLPAADNSDFFRSDGHAAAVGDTTVSAAKADSEITPPSPEPAIRTVAEWAAVASGDDANARMAAILALSGAPRSEALPVLRKVLSTGSADDRELALGSLGILAREQGDADGVIRDVLRETIYHGDNDDILRTARTTLDEVEADVAKASEGARS